MDDEIVLVDWYCGYYVGLPKWHGDFYEPDECSFGFTTKETKWDWDHNQCIASCPSCGAGLVQSDDHPELVEEGAIATEEEYHDDERTEQTERNLADVSYANDLRSNIGPDGFTY